MPPSVRCSMDISEFQQKCSALSTRIREKRGNQPSDYVSFLHIIEEFGEIARELYNEERNRVEFSHSHLAEEFADLFILLADFATRRDIDLAQVMDEKLGELRDRHGLQDNEKK